MKRGLVTVVLFLAALSVHGQSGGITTLDEAVHNSMLQISDGLTQNTTIVIYQFQSPNANISDYVLLFMLNHPLPSQWAAPRTSQAAKTMNANMR
jgi:hypothetical protein